jgi:hypothetical protein
MGGGTHVALTGRGLAFHQRQQAVERAGDGADRARGDVGVERGRLDLAVPEQDRDSSAIDVLLKQMGDKAMPQRVGADALADCR